MTSKISKTTRKWTSIAQSDLRDAKSLLDFNDRYSRIIVFLAQQAVEKILKAYLTQHSKRFAKTHEIEELIKQVAQIDEGLANKLYPASDLTEYAIAYRYPDAAKDELTMKTVFYSVQIADEALKTVLERILGEE